ncbi:MAG TPA: site-specific integrase [Thiobacillus sp.]|nr:site-specific integrase [Thiobacillus sp.]
MATIQKRITSKGTAYRVMIRLKGHPPETATFDRLTDAREWANKTAADIKAGRHFGASKRHTLSELIERYTAQKKDTLKSWRDTERHLSLWLRLLGDCQLDHITPARVAEGRDKLLAETTVRGKLRHAGTVTRIMAALSSCLAYGVKELQWLNNNPTEKASKPGHSQARVRFLSDDERTALLKACKESSNTDLYAAVVLALTTGARKSEVMGLRWPQIDFKARAISLRQGETKNNEARTLPLVGEAFTLLQERGKVRNLKDDRVFPTTARATKATMLDLRTPWETAVERAGLGHYEGEGKKRKFVPDFRWHDLRHTTASYLAMQGVSPLEISKILGHKTMAMVSRYSHLSPGRMVELGDKLAERMGLN